MGNEVLYHDFIKNLCRLYSEYVERYGNVLNEDDSKVGLDCHILMIEINTTMRVIEPFLSDFGDMEIQDIHIHLYRLWQKVDETFNELLGI